MMKTGTLKLLLLTPLLLVSATALCWAQPTINIEIKTILATQTGDSIDPDLGSLLKDLQSVFRYSSYTVVGHDRLSLKLNDSGDVSLPADCILHITPKAVSDGRATLKLDIYSRKRQVFQTVIKLRNKSSLTVGGPRYQGGFLLFNIYGSY